MNTQDIQIYNDTQQFIVDIVNSTFLQTICNPIESCICAYICGSRLTGLAQENSDIDIVVLFDSHTAPFTGQSLIYQLNPSKKITVQWWPHTLEKFLQGEGQPLMPLGLSIIGLFQFGLLTSDLIIYQNPKYQKFVNYLLSIKQEIQLYGAQLFLDYYWHTLLQCQVSLTNCRSCHTIVARLCEIADMLEGNDFTTNIQHYKTIKRGYNLEQEEIYIKNRLTFLKNYQQTSIFHQQAAYEELLTKMQNCLNAIKIDG